VAKLSNTATNFPARVRRGYLAAVASRDARADGVFVYAVRSTGIYCRPSCASRRPRANQVLLFARPEIAERAGFRACRRCHPQRAPRDPRTEMIQRVCAAIETSEGARADLRQLAAVAGVSATHLQRTFRKVMGVTPRQYANEIRLGRLKSNLRKETNVTTAMYEAGYESSSRLYEQSNAQLGMTPATYRRGGRGMNISYSIANCALGRVLVAFTERGISAVFLGDNDGPLVTALREEYPNAEIQRSSEKQSEWVSGIVRHLAGLYPGLDLPTDVVGTAFQRRVWEALRAIPYGATRTYSEVALGLGLPKSTRAVARACATNAAAIVVPCHRVVRKDGSLGGYRWGLKRKEQLLRQESAGARG